MANNQIQKYSKILVAFNGNPLSEETSVTIAQTSGRSQVHTVKKGFAGTCSGSAMCSISLNAVVPNDYWEFLSTDLADGEIILFQAWQGGKTFTVQAEIESQSSTHGADQAASVSLTLIAPYSDWA